MTSFFSSDYHFDHDNIIKYSNRPFENVDEMNAVIIDNHNSRVGPKDELWFLGDFLFHPKPVERTKQLLKRMNGKKHIILGNHDPRKREFYELFDSCQEYREIKIEGQRITLCHYAFRVWNKSHRGAWMLYGHSHGHLADDPNARSIDVGVDCHNFFPLSFEELKVIMAKKNFVPVDHHRESDGDE